MKAIVTLYALTEGIIVADCKLTERPGTVSFLYGDWWIYVSKKHWHTSKRSAREAVLKLYAVKEAELTKKLQKLELRRHDAIAAIQQADLAETA